MFSQVRVLRRLSILFILCAGAPPALLARTSQTWVTSWAPSQYVPEPNNLAPLASLDRSTLRQIVHLSAGGASMP